MCHLRVRFRLRYGTRWSRPLSLRTWQSTFTICCWPPLPETTPFSPLTEEGERERPCRKSSWIGPLNRNREGWSKTENLPLGPGNENRYSFYSLFSFFFSILFLNFNLKLVRRVTVCGDDDYVVSGLYSWVRVFGYNSRGRECSFVKGRGLIPHTSSFLLIYYYYEQLSLSLLLLFANPNEYV